MRRAGGVYPTPGALRLSPYAFFSLLFALGGGAVKRKLHGEILCNSSCRSLEKEIKCGYD